MSSSRERRLIVALPWIAGIIAFAAYASRLGTYVLINDEAKDALNVSYPHPPLMRTVMVTSQDLFGYVPWAARLPSAILSAVAVGLMFALLRRILKNPYAAAAGSLTFAFLQPILFHAPSAYLAMPTICFWLLAFVGIARLEEDPADERGHWMLFFGLALGLWTEQQGILLIPAWLWCQWRCRAALRASSYVKSIFFLGLAQPVLLVLYIAGQPLILGNTFTFYSEHVVGSTPLPPTPFSALFKAGAWLLILAALALACLWLRRRDRRHRLLLAALALTFAPIALMIFRNPVGYYLPYPALFAPLFGALFVEALPSRARAAAGAILIAGLLLLPSGAELSPMQNFIRDDAAWRPLLKNERAVIVLGDYGYELQYYLPVTVMKLPASEAARVAARYYLVFRPDTLDDKERKSLAHLTFVEKIGEGSVYVNGRP